MIDISKITIRDLTEYGDYCMGMIPEEKRSGFPCEMRGITNEVRCDMYHTIKSALHPDDKSFIIDIYDSMHIQVMVARIWLNDGHICLIDWNRDRFLYTGLPEEIYNFEEFKKTRGLPKVPAGILKIPTRL